LKEIALHILDIAENGIAAGATCIHISVDEARKKNLLQIVIQDNGAGIPEEKINKVNDPFVTTRVSRRIGLGLSLLETATHRCNGGMTITSEAGKGATVRAMFRYDHIDRAPLGDMAATISTLVAGNSGIDFVYTHSINGKTFTMDTRDIRRKLSVRSIADLKVAQYLEKSVNQTLERLNRGNEKEKPG
jgi:hypothetical protein